MGVGVAGIFCVPCARIWGKRHLFVLGTLLLGVSSAWGGAAPSYNSLLWSRIVQGFAVAPFESQVNAGMKPSTLCMLILMATSNRRSLLCPRK